MASITLKQGDTTPEFTATLDDPAQELTGNETIRFYMEAPAAAEQQHGDLIVNAEIPASQVDYQTNEVTYDFSAGETSRLDDNLAEVVVTYPDGEVQTFPDTGYHTITVEKPVNRDAPPADLSDPDITVGVVDASQVNAPTLQTVETITGSITGGKALSNIAGANLDIDANGNLNAVSGEDSPSHYNPIYDSDEDGIIDADVDNDVTTTGELSVGGENQTPYKELLRDTPPSDGTTQTFDIPAALDHFADLYEIRIEANHPGDKQTWTAGRTWQGLFWINIGKDGDGNVNTLDRTEIISPSATAGNMSMSIDTDQIISYNGGYNYMPEMVVKSKHLGQ